MKSLTVTGMLLIALAMPFFAHAYVSGSTGADGAFNPTADIVVPLPPSGIFNYTDVNIPANVTVTFAKNVNNTPVYILVTGDVTIDGTISVDGGNGGDRPAGTPGIGGPGGFNGGQGGLFAVLGGGDGQGPGRGTGGIPDGNAGGASYGGFGADGRTSGTQGRRGPLYGEASLRTLIGGSGGGGAGGRSSSSGAGGGGGAGAILIAASGTITINGTISARGGRGGNPFLNQRAGSGSSGAIRLVATTLQGEGTITAQGNPDPSAGGNGRIRLEAENFLRVATTTPPHSGSLPFPALYANVPTLRITTIGGEAAPSNPSGFRDVVLAGITTNPVTVGFETTNIPLGTTITLTAAPQQGAATIATSNAVTGSIALGTATASIDLPNGNSTLSGQAAFTINIASNLDISKYAKYAEGGKVEKIRFDVNTDGESETTFITASGKTYTWPSNAVAMN